MSFRALVNKRKKKYIRGICHDVNFDNTNYPRYFYFFYDVVIHYIIFWADQVKNYWPQAWGKGDGAVQKFLLHLNGNFSCFHSRLIWRTYSDIQYSFRERNKKLNHSKLNYPPKELTAISVVELGQRNVVQISWCEHATTDAFKIFSSKGCF